jgi:hypothetical protein
MTHSREGNTEMTPGEWRHFARKARSEAADLRRMSAETDIRHWKDKWLKDADKREDDADFYDGLASRGEITIDYEVIHERMAAE